MAVYYLGVDLGGTNIACGVVNRQGEILGRASVKTGLPASGEEIADRIARCGRMAAEDAKISMAQVESVGIGTPGIANSERGEVEYSCNLGFQNTPLAKLVSDRLGKPVFLENDANAAALGEYAAGSGRGSHSLVAVTLGTGCRRRGVVIGGAAAHRLQFCRRRDRTLCDGTGWRAVLLADGRAALRPTALPLH